jgi:hypothetical protein
MTCPKCGDAGWNEETEEWCDCQAGQDAQDDEARRHGFDTEGIAVFDLKNDGPANLHDFLGGIFGE